MVPSRVGGAMAQSSSSSGIFFQGDGIGNSHLSSNFGNSSNSLPGHIRANMGPLSGDLSIGASSLVTDANSGLSGGAHLQRSASTNTDSYMRLPASPMSFTSNNISMDGSSVVSNQDPASSATSSRMGQVQLPGGPRVCNSFMQDPNSMSQLQKKPRLDIKQEDVLQQQVLQQLLQRQDSMQLQNPNPQLQALIQQQRVRQQREQQQLIQSMPPMQRVQLLQQQQQQQQQLRQQLLQQGMQPASGIKRPYDGGVCSRRLMQYLYHQRQRPADNTIAYWRKFVTEYYSPRAKQRWCLSLYDNVGHHSLGVFPQAAMDAWQCEICGSKSGRGFEATFEVLPRLNEIKFGSGVIDELLFLDLPRECRFPSGVMMLEYAKAVQESVYEQLRVVREGQLRIIFTPDLKILSWEFCARRHEELLPRRLVAPQVNSLLQVAQKCQNTVTESGPDGVPPPDLQANSVMVVTAGRQLARSLELQSLNDLGFSKRYVRCLQIAEVVNSMKDLMDFCGEQKVGPTEGLKNFPRRATTPTSQLQNRQEIEQQQTGGNGLPSDRNTLNKLMAMQNGLTGPINNNNQHTLGRGAPINGSAQAALALTSYQNMLMRQSSMNSNHSNNNSGPGPMTPRPGPTTLGPSGGFSTGQVSQQNQSLPSQGSQALQQQMIQQLLQDMNNKKNAQQSPNPGNPGGNISNGPGNISNGFGNISNGPGNISNEPSPGNVGGRAPSRSNSFKSASNNVESPAPSIGFSQKGSENNVHISDEMVRDFAHEFPEDGFFNNDDLDDSVNFNWNA